MATAKDAELILRLYELRTEPLMRKARAFMTGLNPQSVDEILVIYRDAGSEQNAYWRQVLSYWEMAAAFVLQDALDADLFAASTPEPLFLYAKFTPFLEAYRAATGNPLMRQVGRMIDTYPAVQERYQMFLTTLEARRRQAQA